MKRDLFVFAGQSNMMGAAVYPPRIEIKAANSFEYKHKPRRLGERCGSFVAAGYPAGEFSYVDTVAAYAADMTDEHGNSLMSNYSKNTYFCPAMSNLRSESQKSVFPFVEFSEATAPSGATLAPLLAQEWESIGGACAYAHIAKGGVPIAHYMTDKMAKEYTKRIEAYNREHRTSYPLSLPSHMAGAADYFFEKCQDFFSDATEAFPTDSMQNRCLFWLQGEADANRPAKVYEIQLELLWERAKQIGFTHFFCIRVDYFGKSSIANIMRAQEDFVSKHRDAYMLTRAASYFPYEGQDESEWFIEAPTDEYRNCRDSFFGFANQHINEKGFALIAKQALKNLARVLTYGGEPCLEKENIKVLQ